MTPQNQIEELRSSVEKWRRSGKASKAMPQELWAAATLLAAQLGVGVVAKTLKIEHGKLKRLTAKLSLAGSGSLAPAQPDLSKGPTFLEVSTAALVSSSPNARSMTCRLEVKTGPSRLRAQLENISGSDVATIFREFAR